MAKQHKLPPRDQYPVGPVGDADRWQDYQLIQEGKPPLLGRSVTEAEPPAPPAPVPDIPPLHELRISDPAAYDEIRHTFANGIFSGHDSRRAGGLSPFSRSVGD